MVHPPSTSSADHKPSPPAAKVLILGEPGSRELLARRLATRGFAAAGAGSAEECLRRLEEDERPAIVLLDLPPGETGVESLRPIRERWPRGLLPVIAVAAFTSSTEVVAALCAGANDHVDKPVDLAVLVARMQVFLDARRLVLELEGRALSLEAARLAGEAANAAKDRFLAMLSHELRAPLTPMLLAAQAIERDPDLSPRHRRAAAIISRSVELESRLIENLLDLTRIAHGKLELRLAEIDAAEVLREAISLCEGEIGGKGIELSLRLHASDHRVRADALRLQGVLWNLLHNAIKFTPKSGRITIHSWSDGERLALQVADTGIGIEPDVLPRIFDPFEQGGRKVTRTFGGLGLGLHLSKSFVEAHGGTLIAHSDGRDRGAAFTLELPLAGGG